jgi:hypothetical protein
MAKTSICCHRGRHNRRIRAWAIERWGLSTEDRAYYSVPFFSINIENKRPKQQDFSISLTDTRRLQ